MIDISVVTETTLREVAKQAAELAAGLQNIAPGDGTNAPNKSVLYLMEIANYLKSIHGQHTEIYERVKQAVAQDKALREQYQIGDKFRFVRDRLVALLANIESTMGDGKIEQAVVVEGIHHDEILVYVYLFNTHGKTLSMWHKMVTPSILYEHSVNRPIYADKLHIESVINKKTNQMQHAYLTVMVKKTDVLIDAGGSLQDAYGHPLVRVKEGSLRFERLVAFTHIGVDYVVDENGMLMRKDI